MTEENQLNIEYIKSQLEELKSYMELSDEELKKRLIKDIEEVFKNPEELKSMKEGYKQQMEQLEGIVLFVEGLGKMAGSVGEKIEFSESVSKVLDFESKPKE